ncbi:MAG: outer membrane lipoprotein carrier protein LolA [Proteobacteria bacterium]|nr:outer membrane lipoprotein carrier protein LolA [Pseudomonadota bacterium]
MSNYLKLLTFLISLSLTSLFTTEAQADIQLLESTIKNLRPFTCRFSQVYYDAFQQRTVSATGAFSFMQPGLMKWKYEDPEEMLFIVGREKAWLYDPDLENVTIQVLEEVSGIRSLRFLSDDKRISDHFTPMTPEKTFLDTFKDSQFIYLSPLKKNQALAELQIVFDEKKHQILQFVLVDHNRNYRKITLTDLIYDHNLKESDFEFTVTESMEVIQGFEN